jgi:quinol monooxygenase YgiN
MSMKNEKYKSKSAMMKHEKTEPMSARIKEYGKKAAKKTAKKSMNRKKGM